MTRRGLRRFGPVVVAMVVLGGLLTACHPAGSVIVGNITFPDGTAAAHVPVAAYASTGDATPVAEATTNIGGDFSINESELADGDYYVRIDTGWWTGSGLSSNAGSASKVTVAASGSAVSVDAQVLVGATITGALVDANADLVAGQVVVAETPEADPVTFTATDTNGAFTLLLAGPGTYRLVVKDPVTEAFTMIGELHYTVGQGQTMDVGTLSIFTTPPLMNLVGTQNFVGGVASQYPEQPDLIRSDMNPGNWAATDAPGTAVINGDQYSPRCLDTTNGEVCSGRGPNPFHDPNGQYYTLHVDSAVPYLTLQVFDARFERRSNQMMEVGDDRLGPGGGEWWTNYQLLEPDATPNDPTDNPVVASATCGGGTGNSDNSGTWQLTNNNNVNSASSFKNTWRTLCVLANPPVTSPDAPYLLRVWTSSDGIQGAAVNRFALRAVGATSPAVDPAGYPTSPVAESAQPRLTARSFATVAAVSPESRPTYPLVEVGPEYAGHTLVLDLFDIGDGPVPAITVNTPTGPQQGCAHETRALDGTITAPATIASSADCTIQMDQHGPPRYNERTLSVQIPIPASYSCDATQRPESIDDGAFVGNGCWWSLSYETTRSTNDITTWNAHVL